MKCEGLSRCTAEPDFIVTWKKGGGKTRLCVRCYQQIVTSEFVTVKPLTGIPLKPADEETRKP